jgi:hypothetical protein
MPKKSLSQKITEALQLAAEFNKAIKTLPPPIRETVLKYAEIRAGRRRGRRRGRRGPGRKPKKAVTQQAA